MFTAVRKSGICARYLFRNLRSLVRARLGSHEGEAGVTHQHFSVMQSLDYLQRVFNDYLTYGGVSKEWLQGKRVLEIGPGDNLGVALLMVASGAGQVVCLDRFENRSNPTQLKRIYQALRSQLSQDQQRLFDEALDYENLQFNPEKIRTVIGVPMENADQVLDRASFDWIVSRAVLEEVAKSRIAPSLETLDRLLRPGGHMSHKIDLRDYGIFSEHGFGPLEYLTLPDWLHTMMSSHEPAPNRKRASTYRAKLEQLNYNCQVWITHLAGGHNEIQPHFQEWPEGDEIEKSRQLVRKIRGRLALEFRALSEEDLVTAGIFLAAQKRQ